MKRIVGLLLVLIVAGAAFATGAEEEGGSLVLAQSKPEIDGVLKEYAAVWSEKTGIDLTIKSCGGDNCRLADQLRADFAAGDMPDIWNIAGIEDYREWEAIIEDLSDQDWVDDTALEFVVDGRVYGQPRSVEGWGMAYNADILDAAGVDPAGLTNYQAYVDAFAQIDSMKDSLGIDSVVSMAASLGMGWVTAHHNFNSLLSNGLPYGDMSVTNDLLEGNVDVARLSEYADWVELLFTYADESVLLTGGYDEQVGAFATGNAAFLHQGNWTDPNMAAANASFPMAFAPHGSLSEDTPGIFVSAPWFWVVNSESDSLDGAKQYLNDLVYTDEGTDYVVNVAGQIPAFGNIEDQPTGQLSQSVQAFAGSGDVYAWLQYNFSGDFRDQTLAPIYNQFASGDISKQQFVDLMADAFRNR